MLGSFESRFRSSCCCFGRRPIFSARLQRPWITIPRRSASIVPARWPQTPAGGDRPPGSANPRQALDLSARRHLGQTAPGFGGTGVPAAALLLTRW